MAISSAPQVHTSAIAGQDREVLRQRRLARRKRAVTTHLLQTAFAAAGLAVFLTWLLAEVSPGERFRQGLRFLRVNSPEGVYYSLFALNQRPEYEEQAGLLQGWLRLQSIRPGEPMAFKDALTELELAADNEQNRALALALVGHVLYQQGRLRDAVSVLAESLEADPDEVEAHRWLGIAFYDIGNVPRALPHLERVAALEPRNGRPHRLMGIMYRDLSDFDRAAAAYEESLARDPHQADADEIRLELARCQFVRLKYDEALAALRPCRETPDVLAVRALCYHSKGLLEQVEHCLERALDEDPNHAEALAVQATLDEEKGHHERAAELLARAVVHNRNDYNLRYRLAQAYRRIGANDKADEQAAVMEEVRGLREDLNTLVEQANFDANNAQIRYGIAALAERLDMPEMAASWRKAAEMLDSMGSN